MSQDWEIGEITLQGNRQTNQDRHVVLSAGDHLLLALADGMGGHPRGEVAAQIVIDTCKEYAGNTTWPIANPENYLTRLLLQSHEQIIRYGHEQFPAIDPRTTAVVALIQKGIAYWAHVGDSRLYLLRDHSINARTEDHSYVEQLQRHGLITPSEQLSHPQRNFVTNCLGGDLFPPSVTCCTKPETLTPGDTILLCSDGLWANINESELPGMLDHDASMADAVSKLAKTAEQSTSNSDNITAIALRWHGTKVEQSEEPTLEQAVKHLQRVVDQFKPEENKA